MKTIHKYALDITEKQAVLILTAAQLLTVQVQNGTPCIWALVDPDRTNEERIFEIFPTGHPIYDGEVVRAYIGTFQLRGTLVFHLFEKL